MSEQASQAFQREVQFLSGVEANFESAKGTQFRGSTWRTSHHDEEDRVRAMMARHGRIDRAALKSIPCNRRVVLRGYERRLWFWKRPTGVAVASVLSPLEHFASDDASEAPPVSLAEVTDHIRRLVGDSSVPHVIGLCSPVGFADDVKQGPLEFPNVTLVLVEPDGHGGWKVTPSSGEADERLLEIFDPEGAGHKIERVCRVIESYGAELLTGSLSVRQVAQGSSLDEKTVERAFEAYAKKDPEVRIARRDGEVLLYRGASDMPVEKSSMNVIDRIRQLFAKSDDDKEKVNMLAERRAALTQRRDRLYEDIAKLESKEAELLDAGRQAKSATTRRRLAAQVAQLRKDIGRQNTTLGMLNKQVNVISTDIHNLTLIQQGQAAKLPDTEELTEHAVAAEEILETLNAEADMAGSLETTLADASASEEELAILKEFEAADGASAAPASEAPPARASQREAKADTDRPVVERDAPRAETDEPASRTPPAPERKPERGDAEPT